MAKKRIPAKRSRRRGRPPEGDIPRREFATLRLDPRLLYLLGIAARKQRRTLSSYLAWAAEQSLDRVLLSEATHRSVADEAGQLWDVDKIERFVKLASLYPDLLNHDEQVLWKLIKENEYVWPRAGHQQPLENLNIAKLQTHWDRFVSVAKRKADKSVLPR